MERKEFYHRYEAKLLDHDGLWEEINNQWLAAQADLYGDRFHDKEAVYVIIYRDGRLITCYSDKIRTEGDAMRRDLLWVCHALDQAYIMGYNDGLAGGLSKPPAFPEEELESDVNPADIDPANVPEGQRIPIPNKYCKECASVMFMTRSGVVCDQGHGGAEMTKTKKSRRVKA